MIGTTIGRYRIEEKLGEGGMGVVYKATDTTLDRLVALKFLPQNITPTEAERTRFIHEAKAASALDQPNICTIHEINETAEGQLYIAMTYYDGESLSEKIEKGNVSVADAVEITAQIAAGLQAAHDKGIVHRDVKSSNIVITEAGRAVIVDFGLARSIDAVKLTKTGVKTGTVPFMSPEQARGETVDHRTDIWSLGVVLYEAISGRMPFQSPYSEAVVYSILNEEPTPLTSLRDNVHVEIERIVGRALRKDRDERYSSASEMLNDLKKYQASLRTEEKGAFDLRSLLYGLRRPGIVFPTIIAILAVSLGSIWFFRHRANVRWAREVALPEIERLIGENDVWRNLVEPYNLAKAAEEYIPEDPQLAELFSRCALTIDITTEPPGARIYMKEYATPESEWSYLGISPIEKIRLPIGIFRWKIEKEGYETILAAASTWNVDLVNTGFTGFDLVRTMDEQGSIPPGMVRVPAEETAIGPLGDFYIDKHEVTNRQYRKFINDGGYRRKEYWKERFMRNGKVISWEDAIVEFVDQTGQPGPSVWQAGDYPEGQGDHPVSGVSWYEAAAYAEYAGKSLPTSAHWGTARGENTPMIRFPQLGGFATFAPFSNFRGKGPIRAGSLPGVTAYGAFDMAGNVREWCWNKTTKGRLIRGGAWNDNTYEFNLRRQAPPWDRSARNGFRCALYLDLEKIPEAAFAFEELGDPRDFYKEKPVPDQVFKVYREQFSYDKTDLRARMEYQLESPGGWIQEKVTFDAAYGGERILAYLFLPKNSKPPYQTVVYFPGSAAAFQRSSQDIENYYEFSMFLSFLVKNGRAVLFPVYKGTFERGDPSLNPPSLGAKTHLYTEYTIQLVKDFKRCIDYLESRNDIDAGKLAFYGMSWGGLMGAIIPAVEERVKVSIVIAGGLLGRGLPAVNQINYVTRVKQPTLMMNGKYDQHIDISIKPMFELLGTPAEHKQLKLYESDHIPPRNEFIRESLVWLDRYLGPVRQ